MTKKTLSDKRILLHHAIAVHAIAMNIIAIGTANRARARGNTYTLNIEIFSRGSKYAARSFVSLKFSD